MQEIQYKRWQVILGAIGFILLMGFVGYLEQEPVAIDQVSIAAK